MTGPRTLTPTTHAIEDTQWQNWHQSVTQQVARLMDLWNAEPNNATIDSYNATTAALQGIVAEAESAGMSLRGLGGGWSFTPVAATTGIMLNTKPLNYQFTLSDSNLDANYRGRGSNLAFAQCGVSIAELNAALFARGKSLRTSGASNGQTVAGAISTGTHGSALDVGAIHDCVVALHIVTASNQHVWLERASNPVASQSLVDKLGARLVRNDELFDAALVSIGSFGIIHGVMLEVDDLFYLQEYRKQYPPTPEVWAAIEQLDFTRLGLPRASSVRPYFFQALFNPHDRAGGPYLTVMYRDATRATGPSPAVQDKWRPGDSAGEFIGAATDLVSALTPAIESLLIHRIYPDVDGVCGTWGEMFSDTSTRGRLASTAMGMPLARVREAVDALYDLNDAQPMPGLFALRYVKASPATLAFTRFPERTGVLEIDGVNSQRVMDFFSAAWDRLTGLGIRPTFHWGKMQPFDAQRLVTTYGQPTVDAWRAARATLLPTPSLQKVFANELLTSLALDQ